MSDPIFAAMKAQMNPSAQAQAELMDKLSQAAPGRRISWKRYAALAACATLALCISPIYHMMGGEPVHKLHDYVTVEGGNQGITTKNDLEEGTQVDVGGVGGDQDQIMTPGELTEAMEEVGFSQTDIDAYQAIGYEMTWGKWWKFVNEQRNTEGEEPFNLYSLKEFSRKELFVNTGLVDELPGGAYAPGEDDSAISVPAQPGADAYQLLMDHFGGTLPDWYGGAYVTSRGTLMVLLVNDKDPGDKTLELEVLDATGGRTTPVGFAGAKYSRNELNRLNNEILALLDGKGIMASWGIYDDQNRIVLDTSEVLPDELLEKLAQLDPDGDAILIRVVTESNVVTDEMVKGPAPIDTVGEEDSGGIDVVHRLPGGTYASDDGEEDLIATEPEVKEVTNLPQVKEPAVEEGRPARTENGE